jgi:hypothetical protein
MAKIRDISIDIHMKASWVRDYCVIQEYCDEHTAKALKPLLVQEVEKLEKLVVKIKEELQK